MRLIDAEEFIEWLLDHIWDEDEWYANRNALDEMILRKLSALGYIKVKGDKYVRKGRIKAIPTVDAEPIIRCEECKYFMCGNGCILQAVDYSWEEQMGADDFCSRGELK